MFPFWPKVITVAALTLMLWLVPTVGTQGRGTRGEAIIHADVGIVGQDAAGAAALRAADIVVVDAVRQR